MVQQRFPGGQAALQIEGQHPAIIGHLAAGQGVVGVRFQARIVHRRHLGVLLQVLRHTQRVGTVAFHAQRVGFQPHIGQPAVEGRRRSAVDLKHTVQAGVDPLHVPADHRPAHDHAVAGKIFGGGVQHNVRAERQRALHVGRSKGIVHVHPGLAAVGDLGHRLNIDQAHGRVGRRLQIGQARLGMFGESLLPGGRRGFLQPDHIDAVARREIVQEAIRGGVERFLSDDRIARLNPRLDSGGDSAHTAGEHAPVHQFRLRAVRCGAQQIQALQGGDFQFGLLLVGVAETRIDVAGLLILEDRRPRGYIWEGESRGLVNWRYVRKIGMLAFANVVDQGIHAAVRVGIAHSLLL